MRAFTPKQSTTDTLLLLAVCACAFFGRITATGSGTLLAQGVSMEQGDATTDDQEVRYYEEGGVTYREVRSHISRPVREVEMEEKKQPVYREIYDTKMQSVREYRYAPVRKYEWQPKEHGRWNLIQGPHVAYHLKEVTNWELQSRVAQVPITERRLEMAEATVQVPVPKVTTKKEEVVTRVAVAPAATNQAGSPSGSPASQVLAWNLAPQPSSTSPVTPAIQNPAGRFPPHQYAAGHPTYIPAKPKFGGLFGESNLLTRWNPFARPAAPTYAPPTYAPPTYTAPTYAASGPSRPPNSQRTAAPPTSAAPAHGVATQGTPALAGPATAGPPQSYAQQNPAWAPPANAARFGGTIPYTPPASTVPRGPIYGGVAQLDTDPPRSGTVVGNGTGSAGSWQARRDTPQSRQ